MRKLLKGKQTSHPEPQRKQTQECHAFPKAPADPFCYFLRTGAFLQCSHRPFMKYFQKMQYALTKLCKRYLDRHYTAIPASYEAKAPVSPLPPPPPVSVQSPCSNTVKIQSQYPVSMTGILELASLTKAMHQTGWVAENYILVDFYSSQRLEGEGSAVKHNGLKVLIISLGTQVNFH